MKNIIIIILIFVTCNMFAQSTDDGISSTFTTKKLIGDDSVNVCYIPPYMIDGYNRDAVINFQNVLNDIRNNIFHIYDIKSIRLDDIWYGTNINTECYKEEFNYYKNIMYGIL